MAFDSAFRDAEPPCDLIVRQPLNLCGVGENFDVVCTVAGGGVTGQAGAIRHGLSRALIKLDADMRPTLKKAGLLTRDPRMKERKKYGLKAARKALPVALLSSQRDNYFIEKMACLQGFSLVTSLF